MRMLLAATALLAACTTTRTTTIDDAGALKRGRHRDVFDAGDLRVTPSSKLRFCRDDACSDWVHAGGLRVDDTGVWLDGQRGYRWSEVTHVEAKGFDGMKTSGAIIGIAATAAVVIPIVLLASAARLAPRGDGVPSSERSFPEAAAAAAITEVAVEAATTAPPPAEVQSYYWQTTGRPATSGDAARLFTTGARVRSYVTIGAAIDASAATEGNLVTSGVVAQLRLGDFLEGGVGTRLAAGKQEDGTWLKTRWWVARGGFHAPVTARFALPVGLDVAWGGDKALSNQITVPFGVRYTGASGRWNATLHPLALAWAKRDGDWKFGVVSGFTLGVTL